MEKAVITEAALQLHRAIQDLVRANRELRSFVTTVADIEEQRAIDEISLDIDDVLSELFEGLTAIEKQAK